MLRLQEVFRITDESDDFYFKAPQSLKVDSEGNFLIIDDNQILKFSTDGRFLKNLFKKGQGPGEISTRYHGGLSYFLLKNDVFLYDRDGNKIIHMDSKGNLIEEIKLKITRLNEMYGPGGKEFIFLNESRIDRAKSGFQDVDMSIIAVSKDGSSSKNVFDFPKKVYWGITSGGEFSVDWARFYGLYDRKTQEIFVSHTDEYKIVLVDLSTGKVIRSFNRKYPRAKYVMTEGLKRFYQRYKPPEKKHENDVLGLSFHKDQLWIKTSTKDEKKGTLFDVFNKEGKYVDNFYLKLNGTLMTTHGDFIFVLEKDEDENLQIVKYKIIDGTQIPLSPGSPFTKLDPDFQGC